MLPPADRPDRLTHPLPSDRLRRLMPDPSVSRRSPAADRLIRRLEKRTARVGVIGLGYVGLPLAVEMGHAGFRVTGFDVDEKRVHELMRGRSYIQDVPTADVRALVRSGHLTATTDFSHLRRTYTVNVCVPTPSKRDT